MKRLALALPLTAALAAAAACGGPQAAGDDAVEIGNEMIVWGGTDGSAMASGGRYRCVPN